jgi:glycosyltransferase involved in cell wall biosynthesis
MPTLSVAMIVRNEGEFLEECLTGLSSLADELVIVDTGSTDDTRRIAEAFTPHVYDYPWSDDFSAARNVSLRQCHGDYIFVLDADERILPGDVARVRNLIKDAPRAAFQFLTMNFTNTESLEGFVPSVGAEYARGFRGWFPSIKIRLFPNDPHIFFEGVVHERVEPSVRRAGLSTRYADIPILHFPHLRNAAAQREKIQRYLALARVKVQQHPDSAEAFEELGHAALEAGEWVEALRAYQAAVRLMPDSAIYLRHVGNVLTLLGRLTEAEQAYRLALRLDPNEAVALRNLAVLCLSHERYAEAYAYFERALPLLPHDAVAHAYGAQAALNVGETETMRLWAQHALALDPDNITAKMSAVLDATKKER